MRPPESLVIYNILSTLRFDQRALCIYGPNFRKNKPKTLVFRSLKTSVLACFRENWVHKFGLWALTLDGHESSKDFRKVAFPTFIRISKYIRILFYFILN
jgi:hypothetical protein